MPGLLLLLLPGLTLGWAGNLLLSVPMSGFIGAAALLWGRFGGFELWFAVFSAAELPQGACWCGKMSCSCETVVLSWCGTDGNGAIADVLFLKKCVWRGVRNLKYNFP